jgi:hypothetical protein
VTAALQSALELVRKSDGAGDETIDILNDLTRRAAVDKPAEMSYSISTAPRNIYTTATSLAVTCFFSASSTNSSGSSFPSALSGVSVRSWTFASRTVLRSDLTGVGSRPSLLALQDEDAPGHRVCILGELRA